MVIMIIISSRSPSLARTCKKFVLQSRLRVCRRELSFQDTGLNYKLTRLLRSNGIRQPTEIQDKAIRSLLAGDNVVINSETGSGKTLAYALPLVQCVQEIRRLKLNAPCPYGLIVVPNTELQYQVSSVLGGLLKARVSPINENTPLQLLDTEIVVSTPLYLTTYLLDVFNEVQTIVFDEADTMIKTDGRKDPLSNIITKFIEPSHFLCFNNGREEKSRQENSFENENINDDNSNVDNMKENNFTGGSGDRSSSFNIEDNIVDKRSIFRDKRQFVFVGATMPTSEAPTSKAAMRFIRNWVPDVNMIKTDSAHKICSNVKMTYLNIVEENKLKLLVKTLEKISKVQKMRVLIFVNTLDKADSLHRLLTQFDYVHSKDFPTERENFVDDLKKFHLKWEGNIHLLHRNVSAHNRTEIFHEFCMAAQSMLVTTDVTARGIDFPDVGVVIQYDFATNVIDTLHRAGRTGRMGKSGQVINFITERDEKLAKGIQEASDNGESLHGLFSRRGNLQHKLLLQEAERSTKKDVMLSQE